MYHTLKSIIESAKHLTTAYTYFEQIFTFIVTTTRTNFDRIGCFFVTGDDEDYVDVEDLPVASNQNPNELKSISITTWVNKVMDATLEDEEEQITKDLQEAIKYTEYDVENVAIQNGETYDNFNGIHTTYCTGGHNN